MVRRVALCSWETIGSRHATIGDLLAVSAVGEALRLAGIEHEVVSDVSPQVERAETLPVWVCGPIDLSYEPQAALMGATGEGWVFTGASLLDRVPKVLADTSTLRDAAGQPTRGDFAVLALIDEPARIAGVLLRGFAPEYGQSRELHDEVSAAAYGAIEDGGLYPLELTTKMPNGLTPSRASASLERCMASCDVVVTSRLHGLIHALRAGRLPIVIDEVIGGSKVGAAARAFGLVADVPGADLRDRLLERLTAEVPDERERAERILSAMMKSAASNVAQLAQLLAGLVTLP